MAQKVLLIIVISFVKIGNSETTIRLNNVFICFIICSLYLWAQINYNPFMNDQLNEFSITATRFLLVNIFFGLFSSVASDDFLMLFILAIFIIYNFVFVLGMVKNFLVLQIIFRKKKGGKFIELIFGKLQKLLEKREI